MPRAMSLPLSCMDDLSRSIAASGGPSKLILLQGRRATSPSPLKRSSMASAPLWTSLKIYDGPFFNNVLTSNPAPTRA